MSPDTEQGYIPGSTISQRLIAIKKLAATRKHAHEDGVDSKNERSPKRNCVTTESSEPGQETQIGDAFILPEPEFRNVAGDVRRRTDQVPVAEAPPTNRPRTQISQQISFQGQRRRRQGLGGDGDSSESESDNNRKDDHGEGSSKSVGKPRQPRVLPEPSGPSSSGELGLTEEEQQRVDIMRTCSRIENDRASKQDVQRQNSLLKQQLARLFADNKKPPGLPFQEVKDAIWRAILRGYIYSLDQQRSHFMNHGSIDHGLDQETNDAKQELWQNGPLRYIEKAEISLLRKRAFYDNLFVSWKQFQRAQACGEQPLLDDMPGRLEGFIRAVSREHWESQYGAGGSRHAWLTSSRPAWMMNGYGSTCEESRLTNILARKYMERICGVMDKASNEDFAAQEESLRPIRECILRSRHPSGSLQPEYINWVFSDADIAKIDFVCYRDSSRGCNHQSQNSVENILVQEKTTMLLITVKGGTVTAIKQVSVEHLPKVGWFLGGGGHYYRDEVDAETGSIFRVDVNGQVVGMYVGKDTFIPVERREYRG